MLKQQLLQDLQELHPAERAEVEAYHGVSFEEAVDAAAIFLPDHLPLPEV